MVTQPRYREIQRLAPDVAEIIADFVGPNGRHFLGLNKLDRIDKHRLLITTFAVAKVSVMCIDDENNPPVLAGASLFVLPGGIPRLLVARPICTTSAIARRPSRYASEKESPSCEIPTHSGQVFRSDAGRDSDLKPATIPN